MADTGGGGQRRGLRRDNPQFSNPESKAYSLQRTHSSIKHIRIEEEDETEDLETSGEVTPSSSNRSLLEDEGRDNFVMSPLEKRCLGRNCRASGAFVQKNGYCADCNRKEGKADSAPAAAAEPSSVRFGRAGSTRTGLGMQAGAARAGTGLGLQAGAARFNRGLSSRPTPMADGGGMGAAISSAGFARQPSAARLGNWKSIGKQESMAQSGAAGTAHARIEASSRNIAASSRNIGGGAARGATGLQPHQQGTLRELRFAGEGGASAGRQETVRGAGTGRGMSTARGMSTRTMSMKAEKMLQSEPAERKEAVRLSFVEDMEGYLRQSGIQLITLFHKLNSAGRRGRIHGDTLLEGLMGLPVLFRDPEGEGEWEEKERQKWLKFLVRAVTDEDKHVTFADMIMLCEWNKVKEVEPFKELRAKDELAWVVAAEVAEVLVGKFGSLNKAFTAIDKDRSKKIERAELLQGIEGAGLMLSKAEAKLLFKHVDSDGSGEIDYKEFSLLMNAGKEQFKKFRADAEAKVKQKKEFEARVREIQAVLNSGRKFEEMAKAMHSAGNFRDVVLDVDAVIEDEVEGMSPGTDDVVPRDVLYDAILDARVGLNKPMVDALMLLAPRRLVWGGNIKTLNDNASFELDQTRRAVTEDITECEIWLEGEGIREVRTVASYSEDGAIILDEPLDHAPTLTTWCEVVDPQQVCYLGLIREVNAMMEAYRDQKKEKEQGAKELRRLDAVAEADIAQIIRSIQMKKVNSITAAWHIFDPKRKNSISIPDFAAGIERLGLEVHLQSTVLDIQHHGKELGCLCHEQWNCPNPECGAWNEMGGSYDSRALEQARQEDMKKTQALQQKRAKEEYPKLPWISLNCNQLMLGNSHAPIKIDFVPTTWTWTEVRLELRNRARIPVWIVFEGKQVMSQKGWEECVKELEDDWTGEKELQGELNVDLVAMCCYQCQQVAPDSFPQVGPSWRAGHQHEETCPLAKWQLQQMLRAMDDNTDLQISYSEFAHTFEKRLATDPRELDALAVVSLVKLKGVRIASTVKKRAGQTQTAEKWDDIWLWITDDKLCYSATMAEHGRPKKSFPLSSLQNVEDVGSTGFKFKVMEKEVMRTYEFEALSLKLKKNLVSTILSPPDTLRRMDTDFEAVVSGVGKGKPAQLKVGAGGALQRTKSGRMMPVNLLKQQSTLPRVERGMTANDLFAELSATKAQLPKQEAPAKRGPGTLVKQPSAAGPPEIELDHSLSARLHREAGAARGVSGSLHHFHRSQFDQISGEPISLATSNGHVKWHVTPTHGCSAELVLWGSASFTASYRISCYCLYLNGVVGQGPNELWHSLRPGHAFEVRSFHTNNRFHCQFRKSSTALFADNRESPLELVVSGQSKKAVAEFLVEGQSYGVEEKQIERRADHAVQCWAKASASLQRAHEALHVQYKRESASLDRSKRIGSLLGSWDPEKRKWEPPISLENVKSEMDLVYALMHVKGKLGDQLLDFRADAELAMPVREMSSLLLRETGLRDKAGVSQKERLSLQQYWNALNAFFQPCRRINLSAAYSATLVRIEAHHDLRELLETVFSLVQKVKAAVPKMGEEARPCIPMERGVLCPAGVGMSSGSESYLFSRGEIIVGDQLQQCRALEKKIVALLPHLREGDFQATGSTAELMSLDKAEEKCIEELQHCTKSLRDCTGTLRSNNDRLPSRALDLRLLHLDVRPLEWVLGVTESDIDWEAERLDPFKGNEITIHFLAAAVPNSTRAVTLSTHFFTLPRASTGPLPLARGPEPCANARTCGIPGKRMPPSLLHSHLTPICGSPTNPSFLRLRVTPADFASEDELDFAKHLTRLPLKIEVWDAESCMALGTLQIDKMHRILRQGRPAVQVLHIEPPASAALSETKEAHQHRQHNAAIPASKQAAVVVSGAQEHEDELGWGTAGVHRIQLLVLIVNSGFMVKPKPSDNVTLAAQGLSGGEDSGDMHVRSWRSVGSRESYQNAWAEGAESSGKVGMGGHARRLLRLREAGGLKRLAVLNVERELVPAASMHLEALHSLKRNRQYRDEQLRSLLQQLVVRERVVRPALGQTPFYFEQALANPTSHPVLCAAYITSIDADNVAPDKRPFLEHCLRVIPHSLPVPDSEIPEDTPKGAFLALLQPSAEVQMQLELANTAEAWQLSEYSARILVLLYRITGSKEVVTQYEVNVTVAPLPVICHRHFRFFQAQPALSRAIQTTLPPGSMHPFTVSALPDVGATIHVEAGADNAELEPESTIPVTCRLSLDLDAIEHSKRLARSAEVEGTGWLNRAVAALYVVIRDATGLILQRWHVEVFRVQPKSTEAARHNRAKFEISADLIERRAFRIYSSDLGKLPIWGEFSLTRAQPHTALFAVKRALKEDDGIFVHLIAALDAKRTLKTPDVTLLVDDSLQCDDRDSRKLGLMLTRAKHVMAILKEKNESVCSQREMRMLKDAGIISFPNSGLANERVVSREQLYHAIAVGKQALKDKRRPNTFNPLAAGPHNGVDPTCFLHAQAPTQVLRSDGQEIEGPGGSGAIFKGQVVAAWLLKIADTEGAERENSGGMKDESKSTKQKRDGDGQRPVCQYECCYQTWASSDLEGDDDKKARQRQMEAVQRQVYRGDKTGKVEQWFSVYPQVQDKVVRYSYLTPEDKPQGPFAEVVKEEARVFFLHAPGQEGFVKREEACSALTDVAWELTSDASGEYKMRLQGTELGHQTVISVPKTIKEMNSLIPEKQKGYQLISSSLRRRARKMVVASFCKLYSWGAVGGQPMLYRGKGVDRMEAEQLRGGGGPEADVARADEDQVEPIEVAIVSVPTIHLDLEEAEWKDFLVDHHNAKQSLDVSETTFPHYYAGLGRQRMPTLEDVRKDPAGLGFWQLRPVGRSLVGRRVRVFCDRPLRHGWNECIVMDYTKDEDGVWRHLLKFEDGGEEEEELDRMGAALVELVPDQNHPEMFLNTRALLLSLCEDLHLALSAFASMVAAYNRKSKRPDPGWSGYLKATSLPWMFCLPPHSREQLMSAIDPLMREALHSVLLEDRGGLCAYISVLEVPEDWKGHFPTWIETVHRAREAPPTSPEEPSKVARESPPTSPEEPSKEGQGHGRACHRIRVVFGQLRDFLLFTPEDLWDLRLEQGLLPGLLSMSEIMSMSGNQRQQQGGREDLQGLLETLVADHSDLRYMQSFWFNHNLLNTARMVPVAQPLSCAARLELSTLHEARTLFKNIDTDHSNHLSQSECATFLSDTLGYLEEEIDAFMEQVDRNQDGSVSWTEFLEGAMSLYRRELKPTGSSVRERGQSVSLEVVKDDGGVAAVEVSESMQWTQVHSQLEKLGLAGYYLEYTDVVVVRELMLEAEKIFEALDDDKSGALDRSEIQEKLELPADKGGHWGFSKTQVEEFIRAADEDGSGSIDGREFLSVASYMLLCQRDQYHAPQLKEHKLARLSYAIKDPGAARIKQKPLRVKCRHQAEWDVLKKRLFPTMALLEEEVRQVESRLGSKEDEQAEKRKRELQKERRLKEREKSDLAKKEALEEKEKLKGKKPPKGVKKKASPAMQAIIDDMKEIDEELVQVKDEIKQRKAKRRKVFVEQQAEHLKNKTEEELRKVCAELHGGSCPTHEEPHTDRETILQVAEALHNSLEGELKRTKHQLKEMYRDMENGITLDLRVVRARQYNLRCLLHEDAHPKSAFIEEISGEWRQQTDKQSNKTYWSSAYSMEQQQKEPDKLALLENKKSGHKFLRKFRKWERTGHVVQVSDVTTWEEMRLQKLREVFHEEFFLVARKWSMVRKEEEWKEMKKIFVDRGVDAPQVIVVRERVSQRNKGNVSRLPRWWTREDSLARGWAEIYDDQTRRHKYHFTPPPGDKGKPSEQLSFPADHIADITWHAKGQPPSKGKDVLKALKDPPQLDSRAKICVNKVTQQVSWVPPESVEDACAMRVRIKKGLVIPNGELKFRALSQVQGQEKPVVLVPEPIAIPYTAKQDKEGLGGWVLRPSMTWAAVKILLRDKMPPVGKDKNFWYWYGRHSVRVETEMDWKDCLVYLMSKLAVHIKLQSDKNDATGSNLRIDGLLEDTYGIYPRTIGVLQIQVLDAEADEEREDDFGEAKPSGFVMLGGAEFHVKGNVTVREDQPWTDMLSALTTTIKMEAVFKYLKPVLINGEASWHACVEEYAARRDSVRELKDLRKPDPKHPAVLDAKLMIQEPSLDVLVDERTKWSQVLFELRQSCAGEVSGLMRGGREVRDEAGWRGLLARSLADRYQQGGGGAGQLQKVAYESLVVLAKALREDKNGPLTTEMARRKEERESGGRKKDEKEQKGAKRGVLASPTAAEGAEAPKLMGVSEGEKSIKLAVEDCVPLLASENKTIIQAEMEFALRRFRFVWRLAKEGEGDQEGTASPAKLLRGGWGQSQKDLKVKKEKEEQLPASVMEVVRRTKKKGKEKVKGAIFLKRGWTEAWVLQPSGAKSRATLSSCSRAHEDHCCQGLLWDIRSTILAQAVYIGEESNTFEYRGPHLVTVKPGLHSLAELNEAIWQQILADGHHPEEELQEKLQIDLDASRESTELAEGWEGPYYEAEGPEGEGGGDEEFYEHKASGRRSEPQQGRPCRLKALGRGKFTPLTWDESSLLTKGVYWTTSGKVSVEPTATALVYSGPHRITLPPASYDLPSLQIAIDKATNAFNHPPLGGSSGLSPAFALCAVNDPRHPSQLPAGWQRRTFKPSEAYIPPMPPASGNRAGRDYYVNLSLGHAQWEEPKSRVQLAVLRAGFQAHIAQSSLRAVLGFGPDPPLLPTQPTSGAGGRQKSFVAKMNPTMTFSDLRRCLSQVVVGAANVVLEYREPDKAAREETEADAKEERLQVDKPAAWDHLLACLQRQAHAEAAAGGGGQGLHGRGADAELEVDLVLVKTGDHRRKAVQNRD